MNCSKPIILMVSHPPKTNNEYYYIFPHYINSLRKSGASVVVITPGESLECISKIYNLCDGVLFTGGGDIEPIHYGGNSSHKNIYGVSKDRDETEIHLAKISLAGNKPVLAICRGLQLINIVTGGTLYEDNVDLSEYSHRKSENEGAIHNVHIIENSQILKNVNTDKMKIISWHHQSIKELGAGLIEVAKADDGTIEACEMPAHAWFLGVQWHPELDFEKEKSQQDIFKIFVNECLDQKSKLNEINI